MFWQLHAFHFGQGEILFRWLIASQLFVFQITSFSVLAHPKEGIVDNCSNVSGVSRFEKNEELVCPIRGLANSLCVFFIFFHCNSNVNHQWNEKSVFFVVVDWKCGAGFTVTEDKGNHKPCQTIFILHDSAKIVMETNVPGFWRPTCKSQTRRWREENLQSELGINHSHCCRFCSWQSGYDITSLKKIMTLFCGNFMHTSV